MPSCKFCDAPLMFKTTEAGKKMPLDAKTVTAWLIEGDRCRPVQVHKTHFETCTKYPGRKKSGGTNKKDQKAVQREIGAD